MLVVQGLTGVATYAVALYILNPAFIADLRALRSVIRPSVTAAPSSNADLENGVHLTGP